MLNVPTALKAHLALPTATIATCWKVTLKTLGSPSDVRGFTDHDADITFGGVTYVASGGYTRTDIQTSAGLNVDTLEVTGFLRAPSVTDDDVRAGVWDFSRVELFLVNYRDLTQGRFLFRRGTIGKISTARNTFSAELAGLTKAYTRNLGRVVTPGCTAVLGDARCKVDLDGGSPPFTVTGVIELVNDDQQTLIDTTRTEPGPEDSTPVQILAITVAAAPIVTTATPLELPHGTPIVIYGAVTTWQVNGPTIIRNPAGSTFQLGESSELWPPYAGGLQEAYVLPIGQGTGFFDNGEITFTTGANAGLSMEIKSYLPGQFTLMFPMPYPVEIGDEYTAHAGCDYRMETCRDRFDNIVNFRGFPYLPGIDRIMQVGKVS